MSQVTIYLPPALAARARREAKRRGTSLSAYVASLLQPSPRRAALAKLYGSCPDLEVPQDSDLLPLGDVDLGR
jgi:hypothetical protein